MSKRTAQPPQVIFAAVVGVLLASGSTVYFSGPEYVRARSRYRQPVPSSEVAYPSDAGHMVLYHGLLGTASAMQRADVVLLGNSRVQFGFTEAQLVPFFEARGQRVYNLAFGFHEASDFPLGILQKHGVRPSLLIISDDNFFRARGSDAARTAARTSAWAARRDVFETTSYRRLERLFHRWVPHWPTARYPNRWLLYRSIETGFWQMVDVPDDRYAVTTSTIGHGASDETLARARRFLEAVPEGVQVVLTIVPHRDAPIATARDLAAKLGLPFVYPELDGLTTIDHSHLSRESAQRFSEAFLQALKRSPIGK